MNFHACGAKSSSGVAGHLASTALSATQLRRQSTVTLGVGLIRILQLESDEAGTPLA